MKTRAKGCRARLRPALCLLNLLLFPALARGDAEDVLINEVDSDTAGSDVLEFIELYDGGAGNTPLDGLVLVFFNGANDTSYAAFDLDGLTANAGGFFVVGNPMVANVGLTFDPGTQGFLQNGADAVALYLGEAANFPNATALTSAGLLDAVVYGTDDPDDSGLLSGLLFPAQLNENGSLDKDNHSISRVPDGGTAFDSAAYVIQDPTPGVTNVTSLEISLAPSPSTLAESGGATVSQVMVSLDAAPGSDLTVTLTNADATELAMPPSLVIPAGMTNGTFEVTAVDDAWPDGDKVVRVTASAVGFLEGLTDITVQDDGDADPGIVVNEIYATVDSSSGDTNQDGLIGAADGSDEFVEIVNATSSNVDLAGYTLSDAAAVRHTFPLGTVLEPGCAVVVFGGGNILEGRLGAFGGAIVQKANGSNSFGLSLNNTGDLVSLRNTPGGGGLEVAGYSFGTSGSTSGNATTSFGSFTRNPDLVGDFQLGPYTPGYQLDAFTPFCPLPPLLGADPAMNPVFEDGGSVTLELTVPSAPASDLTILLSSSRPGAATVPAMATIAGGTTSTEVTVTLVDNAFQNPPVEVILAASALGHLTGIATLTINDEGDPPVLVTINEVDYDPAGTDTAGAEFVELYSEGIGNVGLDGHVLVLYNGNAGNDGEYGIIDLNGVVTDANGFAVITTPQDGLQNGGTGGDAIALYSGAAALDFDNTVPGGAPPGAVLADSLVYEAGDGGLLAPLNYTGPDLVDNGIEDGISRLPDGTGTFQLAPLTRGLSNGTPQGNGYTQWAAGFPGIGGPGIDDEFDGLANLLEYVFGRDPTSPDPSPGLVPVINGNGRPQVSIAIDPDAGADPLLGVRVEVSTNLADGSWSTSGTNVLTDTDTALVVEYTGGAPAVSMRVVATYP